MSSVKLLGHKRPPADFLNSVFAPETRVRMASPVVSVVNVPLIGPVRVLLWYLHSPADVVSRMNSIARAEPHVPPATVNSLVTPPTDLRHQGVPRGTVPSSILVPTGSSPLV